MAVLNIRNLPDEIHAKLRIRAAQAGRSMEAEARTILTEVITATDNALTAAELQQWVQALYDDRGGKPQNVVEKFIEERRLEAAAE
jgi:plasmid stability protein